MNDANDPQAAANTNAAQTGAMNTATPRVIDLTPNYKAIFAGMLHEAKIQAKASRMFEDATDKGVDGLLRCVQRWFAPLAIAINAASSVADIEQVRGVMADILSDIDRTAAAIENDEDDPELRAEYRRGFEDGKKGLL